MKMKKCETPFGYAIFCDEVRIENTGKQIYIGVYNYEMVIPTGFPVRLRSLAVIANLAERPNESRDDVKFIVSYSGIDKPIAETIVPRADLDALPAPQREPEDGDLFDPIMAMTVVFNMVDVNLSGPGRITVAAERGSESIHLARLKVSHSPIPQPVAIPA